MSAINAATSESLEARTLFTETGHSFLKDGWIRLLGTSGNDTMIVTITDSATVTNINGYVQRYPHVQPTHVLIDGHEGDDFLDARATKVPNLLSGNDGNDTIYGGSGENFLAGNDGDDDLHAGPGRNNITGDNGTNSLWNVDLNDTVYSEGNDQINGASDHVQTPTLRDGVVRIDGSDANDNIVLTTADTRLFVAINGKYYTIADGATAKIIVHAKGGDDSIDLRTLPFGATVYGDDGDDLVLGSGGADRIYGGAGDDSLCGLNGHDILYGDAGDDQLLGGNGSDFLDGGEGSDNLKGEFGIDHLIVHPYDGYTNKHDWIEQLAV